MDYYVGHIHHRVKCWGKLNCGQANDYFKLTT